MSRQVLLPEQPPPDQPVNRDPLAGVAVSVTCSPNPKLWEQTEPQWIPTGELTTVPDPVPDFETDTVKLAGL